jgi:hypothetical protein
MGAVSSSETLVPFYQIIRGVASQMMISLVSVLGDDIAVVGWFALTLRDLVISILW